MKKCNKEYQMIHTKNKRDKKRGPSSFNMHDSSLIFNTMKMNKGDTFIDIGCGIGEYSLYASQLVGEKGKVYAVDIWKEMLDIIEEEADFMNINNIETIENDICQAINIKDNCADHCLLATVMHAQKISEKCQNLFPEIARILKPGCQLGIVECKKEEMSFGPPLNMRISPEELEAGISSYGFKRTAYVDLGCNYMVLFVLDK